MAITSLKTNAFRRSLSSYCQNFTVSFPVGTLKWRNSLLALAQALTRGPLCKGTSPLQNTFVPEIGAPNWGKSDPDRLLEGGSHQECHYAPIHELDKRSRVDWTLLALVWDNVHADWQLQLRVECRHIKAQIYSQHNSYSSSLKGKNKFEIPLQWYTVYNHLNTAYSAGSGI